jgi:hypothetical protein
MMSLAQIAENSRKAAKKAAREHRKPYLFEEEDRVKFPPFPFPNIGDYRPGGWKLVETYFVDSSGWGSPGEAALTIDAFLQVLKPGFGYAIIEAGEFQVYIGEFRREE